MYLRLKIAMLLGIVGAIACWLLSSSQRVSVGPVSIERRVVVNTPPPLISAAMRGDVSEMSKLLDADPAIIDDRLPGCPTALLLAVQFKRIDGVRLLLDRGAPINAVVSLDTMDGSSNLLTPLLVAAYVGDPEMIRLLLSRGADPTIKNGRGQSPSDVAVNCGHPEIAASLRRAMHAGSASTTSTK